MVAESKEGEREGKGIDRSLSLVRACTRNMYTPHGLYRYVGEFPS